MKTARVLITLMFVLGMYCVAAAAADNKKVKAVVPEKKAAVTVDTKKAAEKRFDIYSDKSSPNNHYAPSGWMGDYGDLRLDYESTENPYAGSTCVKVVYSAQKTQQAGWAGIYWQNPPNNWGTKKGGFDLTGFNKLVFRARGQTGEEVISKVVVGGIGMDKKVPYPDSDVAESEGIKLTDQWQEFYVNLEGKDLSYLNGAFAIIVSASHMPEGGTIYFDEVYFTYDPALRPVTGVKYPFYVYADAASLENHFIPSGYMGDYSDIKVNVQSTEAPYSGETCIKTTYTNARTQGQGWAGVYWMNPANNWGTTPKAGFGIGKATKLTFWAKGAKGDESVTFKMGGIFNGPNPDSDVAQVGPVKLTKDWQQFTIDLRGKDLSYVIGGFCWATDMDSNPDGITFYLDDIRYEAE